MEETEKKRPLEYPDDTLRGQLSSTLLKASTVKSEKTAYSMLSPGMKSLIRERLDNTALEIRAELDAFTAFIDEIQQQVPSEWEMVTVSPLPSSSFDSDINCSFRGSPYSNLRAKNAALRDAFHTVKKLLLRIVDIISDITLRTCSDEDMNIDVDSAPFNVYYAHYVFQLTYFMLQVLTVQVTKFAQTLLQETRLADSVATAKGKLGIDTHPFYSFIQKKDGKSSPDHENEYPNDIKYTPKEVPVVVNVLPATIEERQLPTQHERVVLHALANPNLADNHLRRRISDALEVLIFLSEKMLSCIQNSSISRNPAIQDLSYNTSVGRTNVCPDCLEKLTRFQVGLCGHCQNHLLRDSEPSKRLQILDSNSSVSPENELNKFPPDLFSKSLPGTSLEKTKSPNKTERISISGIFNIETFAERLKEDLNRYKSRKPWQIPDNSKIFEASSILNIVIQSFKDSSVTGGVEISRQFVDDKIGFRISDVEKDTRSEMPSFVASHDRDIDQILKNIAEESIRIALQNVDRKRNTKKPTTKKEFPSKKKEEIPNTITAIQNENFLEEDEKLCKSPDNSNVGANQRNQNKINNPNNLDKKNNCLKKKSNPGNTDKTTHSNNSHVNQSNPDKIINPDGVDEKTKPRNSHNKTGNSNEENETGILDKKNNKDGKKNLDEKNILSDPDKNNNPDNKDKKNDHGNPDKNDNPGGSDEKNNPSDENRENNAEKMENKSESPARDSSFSEEDETFSLSDCLSSEVSLDNPSTSGLLYRKGSLLHKDIDQEDRNLVEIREISQNGRVKVTLSEEKSDQDSRDDRWQTNVLNAFVIKNEELERDDPVFQPPYSSRATPPRKSAAATHLQIVHEVAAKHSKKFERQKHASLENLQQKENISVSESNEESDDSIGGNAVLIVNKLWALYDELQENELFNGPPLALYVRENQILEDAFLLLMTPSMIPLTNYRFIKAYITDRSSSFLQQNLLEECQTEEFFQLLVEGLFSPEYKSLFRYSSEDSDFLYPNPVTHSHPRWFEFAGVVLALTIVHQHPVKVKFPKCFFNCILDRPLGLEDLEELDPLLHQRLLWIKDNDVTKRRISFSVKDSLGDEPLKFGLLSRRGILVTEENKFLYIERCLKWKLAESCLEQLKNLRRGFISVLDPRFLSDFTDVELQQLCLKSLDELAGADDVRSSTHSLTKTRSF